MSHLGERLTALVDGELGHDERDRALAHLAACEQCRAEAETLRRLKSRLRSLPAPPPAGDFLRRLNALGEPGGATPPPGATRPASTRPASTRRGSTRPGPTLPGSTVPGSTVPGPTLPGSTLPGSTVSGSTVPGSTLPGGPMPGAAPPPGSGRSRTRRPLSRRRDRRAPSGGRAWGRAGAARRDTARGRYLIAGAATLAVLGVGAASFAAGAQPERLPQVTPALERFAVEHALTSGDVPIADPTAVREHSFGP